MNPIHRFFRKYVGATLAAIGIFLLMNCILILLVIFFSSKDDLKDDTSPYLNIIDLSAMIGTENGEICGSDEVKNQLASADAWAMLLDESGNVIWEDGMPSELPRSYSIADIAKFSRWYLNDYPVYVWEHDLGLLVVGYPQGSLQKYCYTVSTQYYPHLVVGVLLAFVANLLLMLFLLLRNNLNVEKALKPILTGIGTIAQGQAVHLSEEGELLEVRAELNHTSEQLQKKDAARAEWISGISHDIRTPLTMILGYAGEMEDDRTLPVEVNERAGMICRQGEKLRQLISDLNFASKLEYAMQPLTKAKISPVELARQSMSEYINHGIDEKYCFDINVAEGADKVLIEGDQTLLLRLFDNAIGNSIWHNPDGCEITTIIERKESDCLIVIRDTGSGVDPELLSQLNFKSNTAIKRNDQGEVMHGNGLKLMRQIVNAHGGGIYFSNVEPHGFEVRINLPISG